MILGLDTKRDLVETIACIVVLLVFVGFCGMLFSRELLKPYDEKIGNEVIFVGTWMTRELGGLIYARVRDANGSNGSRTG